METIVLIEKKETYKPNMIMSQYTTNENVPKRDDDVVK